MFVVIMDRKSNIHIIDYVSPGGTYWSICGLNIYRKELFNSLSLDGCIPGICHKCKRGYKEYFDVDLEIEPNKAFASIFYSKFLNNHRRNALGPKVKFDFVFKKKRRNKYAGARKIAERKSYGK